MRKFDIRSLLVVAIVAAFSSSLLGCPDKAAPDPATATKDAGTAAAAAAAPGASAAAPAKSGGW
ncbi:MAG: hypothetical protein JWO86_5973 [Myxococcaceae bacterium]|jgi:hypothetical protein|nr:hypothetical protein [Myxococcaceae bacterium]MEA2748905.1 hypothetical protein [Myxococcales bacterium]